MLLDPTADWPDHDCPPPVGATNIMGTTIWFFTRYNVLMPEILLLLFWQKGETGALFFTETINCCRLRFVNLAQDKKYNWTFAIYAIFCQHFQFNKLLLIEATKALENSPLNCIVLLHEEGLRRCQIISVSVNFCIPICICICICIYICIAVLHL